MSDIVAAVLAAELGGVNKVPNEELRLEVDPDFPPRVGHITGITKDGKLANLNKRFYAGQFPNVPDSGFVHDSSPELRPGVAVGGGFAVNVAYRLSSASLLLSNSIGVTREIACGGAYVAVFYINGHWILLHNQTSDNYLVAMRFNVETLGTISTTVITTTKATTYRVFQTGDYILVMSNVFVALCVDTTGVMSVTNTITNSTGDLGWYLGFADVDGSIFAADGYNLNLFRLSGNILTRTWQKANNQTKIYLLTEGVLVGETVYKMDGTSTTITNAKIGYKGVVLATSGAVISYKTYEVSVTPWTLKNGTWTQGSATVVWSHPYYSGYSYYPSVAFGRVTSEGMYGVIRPYDSYYSDSKEETVYGYYAVGWSIKGDTFSFSTKSIGASSLELTGGDRAVYWLRAESDSIANKKVYNLPGVGTDKPAGVIANASFRSFGGEAYFIISDQKRTWIDAININRVESFDEQTKPIGVYQPNGNVLLKGISRGHTDLIPSHGYGQIGFAISPTSTIIKDYIF